MARPPGEEATEMKFLSLDWEPLSLLVERSLPHPTGP